MDTIDKINFYLAKTGKTGADLSRALGLSNSIYSQWNTRKTRPSRARLPAIAAYLQVTVEDILPDEDDFQKSAKKDPATDGGEVTVDDVKAAIWETNDPKKLMEFSRIINEKMQELLG